MPYEPIAPTEEDRARVYRYMWAGAACALFTLGNHFYGYDGILNGWILGGAAGGVLASAITGRTDDYFRSLCAVGHRWAVFVLSAYLIAGFVAQTADWAHGAGYALASGGLPETGGMGGRLMFDGYLFALVMCAAFYAGYAFAWARDHDWGKDS